ncbi:TonB-dependent receptor [uncultured Phenylobacterium sp.]|uniref:TonB-dependent receptor n=1 Tax=uncultured Phenylobacterium sp. TaxID=349273 RepID=UPI0025E9222E|nr:TonB-dependent receptor [uncultured Phenylobacterium sp.]
MNRRISVLCSVSCLTLVLAAPAVAQQAASADADAPSSMTSVEEIVVTAQKREESINTVPMSVQAATGERLTELGITDTSQLTKIAPGFSYTPSAYGTPVFSIRGVGFQDTSLAASPTVSVYVDQSPLPFSIMTTGAVLDLQRVEVLKGPQGTLFGQNATGGAVNYIANKPTQDFQAGVDASYGRFNTVDLQGFVSGPISDTLEFRVAARTLRSGPWQKSYTRDDELGSQNLQSFRAALQWRPTESLTALLTLSGFQDKGETQAAQLYGLSALNSNTAVPPGLVNYPLAPHNNRAADWGPCVNSDPVLTNSGVVGLPHEPRECSNYKKDNTFWSANLRLDYELGDDLTVTSLTTYQRFDRDQPIDGDGTTFRDYESLQRGHLNVFFQELRLAGRIRDTGNFIVGANYEYDDTWDNFLQTYSDSSSATIFGDYLGPTRPLNQQKTHTYGIFANAEVPISDTLSVQGGARYTKQVRHFFGCGSDAGDGSWALGSQRIQNLLITGNPFAGPGINPGPTACGTTGPAPNFAPGLTFDKLNEDNVSWRAGVNWKPQSDTLVYANISRGYKSGSFPTVATASFVQLAPATQESLLAYETGIKARLLDGSLQLNAAVFYYDYKDKQILGSVNDLIFGALPALVNVPKSHVKGFEVSGAWRPVTGLTITPSISYSDSEIDGTFVNFNYKAQQQDFGGEAFPLAPKWQGNVDVQYEWPLRDEMTAFVGASLNYQGKTNSGFGRFPELKVPSYALLDLRAGVEQGAWRAQVWGRNVTDKWYWNGAYHVNDVFVRYTGMPATYGVTVSYRYQ